MKKGFTMVEMVVVVGVLGVIMTAVTGILINSFRAKTRIEVSDQAEQVGEQIQQELRNNLISANGVGMTCVSDNMSPASTISFVNSNDGVVTTLACYEGSRIASESANGTFVLTNGSVGVSGCNNFARCDLYPNSTDKVSQIHLGFNLMIGSTSAAAEQFVNRKFQTTVVVRN